MALSGELCYYIGDKMLNLAIPQNYAIGMFNVFGFYGAQEVRSRAQDVGCISESWLTG